MLRHAASSWATEPGASPAATVRDVDRPLTAEGRAMAQKLAAVVRGDGRFAPDVTLCSNSARSRETLELMSRENAAFKDSSAVYLGSLYHFASLDGQMATHLRELVTATTVGDGANDIRTILCVGHNKGMEEATSELCGRDVQLQVATAALLEKTYACDIDDENCEERSSWRGVMACKEKWTLVALATPDGVLNA